MCVRFEKLWTLRWEEAGVAVQKGFSKFVGRQICFGNEVKAMNLFLKRKRLKRLLNFENFWWMGNISALFLNITFFSQMCSQDLSGMRWKRLIWFKEKKPQKQIKFEIFWWTGFISKLFTFCIEPYWKVCWELAQGIRCSLVVILPDS